MNTQSRVERLTQLAEGLSRGQTHPLTRLAILKPLCETAEASLAFALFGASAAVRLLPPPPDAPTPERRLVISVRARIAGLRGSRARTSQTGTLALLDTVASSQSERRRIPFGVARIITSRPLFIAESALRLALAPTPSERGVLGYRLSVALTRRYDSRYGGGLIPESAVAVAALAHFFAHLTAAPNPGMQRTRYARR